MKYTKDIGLKLSIGIGLIGVLITCYLWTFVNGDNHWQLFGTVFEIFLMQYGIFIVAFFSICFLLPLLFNSDKKRVITALMAISIFIFLNYSLTIFLD